MKKTDDAEAASVARLTCDNISREFNEALAEFGQQPTGDEQ